MTFRIQAIHIALLFCLISTFALLPASQARAVVNDVAMVEETVQNFYEKYLKAVQNHLEFDLKKQWEIHPAFAQKIENLIREAEKTEPGFLGYDPILMAQDIPIRLEYEMAGVGTPFAAMLLSSSSSRSRSVSCAGATSCPTSTCLEVSIIVFGSPSPSFVP